MELIRRFPPETFKAALSAWAWLPELTGLEAQFSSAFGDVFLQGSEGYWFLDTVSGTLAHRWSDLEALQRDLNDPEIEAEVLMPALVQAATEAGLVPGADQILFFTVPPALGGALTVENLELADFVVAIDIAGQIHEQIKDLPPGTVIGGVEVR